MIAACARQAPPDAAVTLKIPLTPNVIVLVPPAALACATAARRLHGLAVAGQLVAGSAGAPVVVTTIAEA